MREVEDPLTGAINLVPEPGLAALRRRMDRLERYLLAVADVLTPEQKEQVKQKLKETAS